MTPQKSKGHFFFDLENEREFLHDAKNNLCIADTWRPIGTDGYRMGARFECTPRPDFHVAYIREVFGIDLDQSWKEAIEDRP